MADFTAHQDPNTFDTMSLEQLDALLQADFQAPEGDGSGAEAVLRITESIARRRSPGPDVDAAWRQLQTHYLPRVKKLRPIGRSGAFKTYHAAGTRRHVRRTTCGVLVIAALLAALTATAQASGGIRRLIARWTDEVFTFVSVGDQEEAPPLPEDLSADSYTDIQSALAELGVDTPAAPRWLPDGFTRLLMEMEPLDASSAIVYACYRRGEGSLVINILVNSDGGTSWQKDEGAAELFEAGGVTHFLMENAGRQTAVWVNGPLEVGLSGDITREEMKQILESIYG